MLAKDVVIALTVVGIPVAIASGDVIIAEVVATNILDDTLVTCKTEYYYKKGKHLSKID